MAEKYTTILEYRLSTAKAEAEAAALQKKLDRLEAKRKLDIDVKDTRHRIHALTASIAELNRQAEVASRRKDTKGFVQIRKQRKELMAQRAIEKKTLNDQLAGVKTLAHAQRKKAILDKQAAVQSRKAAIEAKIAAEAVKTKLADSVKGLGVLSSGFASALPKTIGGSNIKVTSMGPRQFNAQTGAIPISNPIRGFAPPVNKAYQKQLAKEAAAAEKATKANQPINKPPPVDRAYKYRLKQEADAVKYKLKQEADAVKAARKQAYLDKANARRATRTQARQTFTSLGKLPIFGRMLQNMWKAQDKSLLVGGVTDKVERLAALTKQFGVLGNLIEPLVKGFTSLSTVFTGLISNPVVLATALAAVAAGLTYLTASAVNAVNTFMVANGHFLKAGWQSIGLSIIKPFLEISGELKQMKSGYIQSAGGTEAGFAKFKDIAKLPGLTYPGAIQAGTRLVASGMDEDFALKLTERLGSAVSKLPNSAEALSNAMYALSQMQGSDAISQLEIRQILQHIPELGRLMREAFGTQRGEDIEAMGFTGPEFVKIISDLLGTVQATTPNEKTAIENWDDAVYRLSAAFGDLLATEAVPFIESVTAAFENLTNTGALKEMADGLISLFGLDDPGNMVKTIKELPEVLGNLFSSINSVVTKAQIMWEAAVTFFQNVEEAMTWIADAATLGLTKFLRMFRGEEAWTRGKSKAEPFNSVSNSELQRLISEGKAAGASGKVGSSGVSSVLPGTGVDEKGKPNKTMDEIKKSIASHKKVGEDQLKVLDSIERNTKMNFESFSHGGNDALRRGFSVTELESIKANRGVEVRANAGIWSSVIEDLTYQIVEQLVTQNRLATT